MAPSATSAAAVSDFYLPPSPLPSGAPGAVLRSRAATVPATTLSATVTTVMYRSRTAQDADMAVTGTVFTPRMPWLGGGPRPWVTLAVGTQGLGAGCAPSRQFVATTEYELPAVEAVLLRGWGVVLTDYEGYTTGSTPTYITGPSEAHAVLDMARAARAVPGTGITSATPWATMGYSQGGSAAGWATALAPSYAPEIRLVANVSGGVPADPRNVIESLDGALPAGLQFYALIGFQQAYPGRFPLDAALSAAGRSAVATLKTQSVDQTIAGFPFKKFADFSTGETIQQFNAHPDVGAVYAANTLGAQPAPRVPVYQYHSPVDEIVPFDQARALSDTWRAQGVHAAFTVVAGEHVLGETAGLPGAVAWLADRFAGRPLGA